MTPANNCVAPACRLLRKPFITCLLLYCLVAVGIAQPRPSHNVVVPIDEAGFHLLQTGRVPGDHHFRQQPVAGFRLEGTVSNFYYFLIRVPTLAHLNDPHLSIENTRFDSVIIYRIQTGTKAEVVYSGGRFVARPPQSTPAWHNTPLPAADSPALFLVAIKTADAQSIFRYEILNKEALFTKYRQYERFVFFYIGLACMTAASALLGFAFSQRREWAVLTCFILSIYAWVFSYFGILQQYLAPLSPQPARWVEQVSAFYACFFFLLLFREVLKKQLVSAPKLRAVVTANLAGLFVLCLVLFIPLVTVISGGAQQALSLALKGGLVLSICVAAILAIYFSRSGLPARLLLFALLLLPITGAVHTLYIPGLRFNQVLQQGSVVMSALLMTTVLTSMLFYLSVREHSTARTLSLDRERSDTLKKLLSVQDNERRRIAGDLHDNIGPLLAALKINFRRIIQTKGEAVRPELVEQTELIIDDSIAEIRNVAHNLMPKGLSTKGLITTLSDYFDSVEQLYNTRIIFTHQIKSILSPELQLNIYRILGELVLNAARHSKAHAISVTINADEAVVSLGVSDNGTGFRLNSGYQKQGLGLQNTKNRVAYLRGQYTLKSRPGRGTSIDMEIPLQFHQSGVESF